MIKKTILVFYILSLLTSCATVRQMDSVGPLHFYFPSLTPTDLDLTADFESKNDYKLRERREGPVRLLLISSWDPDTFPEHLQAALTRKLDLLFKRSGVDHLVIPAPEGASIESFLDPEDEETLTFLHENNIDGIIVETRESTGELKGRVAFRMIDPIFKTELATLPVAFSLVEPSDRSSRKEMVLTRTGYMILPEQGFTGVKLDLDNPAVIRPFLQSSVNGYMSLLAGEGQIQVKLLDPYERTIRITQLPVENLRLDEGIYQLEAKRFGFPVIRRRVRIRSGITSRVVLSWSDDPGQTSMAIYSLPPQGRVSMDGIIMGQTPYFQAVVTPGLYDLELARSEEEGQDNFFVEDEARFQVHEGKRNDLIFMERYLDSLTQEGNGDERKTVWQSASSIHETDVKFMDGLRFNAMGDGSDDDVTGIVSRPFYLNDTRFTVKTFLGDKKTLRLGFVSGKDGVLLERRDGAYYPVLFHAGEMQGTLNGFSPEEEPQAGEETEISFCYDQEEGNLKIRIGFTTVYDAKWEPSGPVRAVILTDKKDAKGEVMASRIDLQVK